MSARAMLFLILPAVLVSFIFLRDPLIKVALVVAARQVAGVEVRIDSFSMSLIRQSALIKGLKAYNPPGFDREVMIDIPELAVDLDVGALLQGGLHLRFLRLDLKQVVVVRNAEGKTNVNSLQFATASTKAAEVPQDEPGLSPDRVKKVARPADIKLNIDLVSLNLGRVVIKELRPSGAPSVREITLNVKNKEYRNVKSASVLAGLVMTEALISTPFKNGFIKVKGLSAEVTGGLLDAFRAS